MGFVFLLVRIALGGFFVWRGVGYLDPALRQAAIARVRTNGSWGSDLTFVIMGFMMLTGGMCIVMGAAPGAGVAATVTALGVDSLWRFQGVATNRTTAIALVRTAGLAATALLMLLMPRPWPFSFVG
ncbi:MAG: hypothetical protein WC538_03535 [Thermoanaerobaculia bacterium]|jgi:hypothetical protein